MVDLDTYKIKKLITILLFSSFALFGQEPIYNISSSNLHLLNYAYHTTNNTKILADNSFEYYNNDKIFNSTNIYFDFAFRDRFAFGLNTNLNFQNNKNNKFGFDGIIKYKIIDGADSRLFIAVNLGLLKTNIYFPTLQMPYSFSDAKIDYLYINKTNLNIGFSSQYEYKKQFIGFSLNHINKPKLPFNDTQIPIKYTAFIRNEFGRISSILSYVYQNDIFNTEALNSYYGIELTSILGQVSLLGGYKYLSNFNDIYSVGAFININGLNLKYNFSILQDNYINKTAMFHQIGINYYFYKIRRLSGAYL